MTRGFELDAVLRESPQKAQRPTAVPTPGVARMMGASEGAAADGAGAVGVFMDPSRTIEPVVRGQYQQHGKSTALSADIDGGKSPSPRGSAMKGK